MRIRSRIIIFVLIIIILFLGSRAEFLGSGDALLFFISNNKFVILEDPEPNYYFINNKNLGISFEDPEPDCRVRIRIIYFINNNYFINFEDPEPNYYFVKKNNIYFNNVRVLSESNMRFIIRIIIVLLIIILLF